ncbi:hypothetical protein [Kitasatospora sp. NPDC093102]
MKRHYLPTVGKPIRAMGRRGLLTALLRIVVKVVLSEAIQALLDALS